MSDSRERLIAARHGCVSTWLKRAEKRKNQPEKGTPKKHLPKWTCVLFCFEHALCTLANRYVTILGGHSQNRVCLFWRVLFLVWCSSDTKRENHCFGVPRHTLLGESLNRIRFSLCFPLRPTQRAQVPNTRHPSVIFRGSLLVSRTISETLSPSSRFLL